MEQIVLLLTTLTFQLTITSISLGDVTVTNVDSTSNRMYPLVIASILKRHFFNPNQAILINHVFKDASSGQRQQDLLNEVIHRLDSELAIRFFYPRTDYVRPRFYNLFVVDGNGSFQRIYETMDYSKYDSSGFFLVVIAGDVQDRLDGLIRQVFEDLWSLDIFNVNLVVEGIGGEVLIYTFFPYSENHCGRVEFFLWHKINSTEWVYENVDLYPHRLRSFHGCLLTGGTLEAKPYSIFRRLQNSSEITVTGFEGDLVDLLAVKLNFTVRYKVSPAAWGFAREKGNSTGVMKMIQEEQVDFGVGCLAFAQDRHFYLKPGIAHYTSKVLFAVPVGRPFTAFEKLFRPFSATIWYLMMLYLAIGAVVTFALQFAHPAVRDFVYGTGLTAPYLNVLNVFYGGPLPRTPSRNFARTLALLWILFCFVIRTLYQGSLYLYLQRSMNHKPLETMADIKHSGIQYHMMEIGQRYFTTMPYVLERTTFITPGKDALGKMVEKLGAGAVDGVVLIPLDQVAYHNKISPKSHFVQIAREHVSVYPVGFYYPKKSHLTKVFNDQIWNIQSTGLIDFWIRRYGDYEFFKKQPHSAGPRKLTNHHLAGGYQVFACWLTFSVVVFALELLSIRFEWLRRLLLFITE